MTAEELRALMEYLRAKVCLQDSDDSIAIEFITPTENEMIDAGLNEKGVKRILNVSWWGEMVEDIVETPEMCDPEDPSLRVLEYAKDVVSEYIRKWFPLNEE